MALPYFYDGQTRRVITHFMRVFSGFQIVTGQDSNGLNQFRRVPVVWGGSSRQAQHIINENSENAIMSVPRIAVYLDGIELAEDRLGYQANFDTNLVIERQFDEDAQSYTQKPGNRYEVNRLQFRPLDFNFKVDIVTSNMEQKLQLFEQIVLLFNPALEIQKTTNPLDWTAIDTVRLMGITFDQQGIPQGTEEELQVMSMDFKTHTQISPPARVKKQVLIENIIQMIGRGADRHDIFEWDCGDPPYPDIWNTSVVTPGNHYISVENDRIRLLGPCGQREDANGNPWVWSQLIDRYGTLKNNFSRIRLFWHNDLERPDEDIVGRIEYDPNDPSLLLFFPDLDTLPSMTLDAVNAVINPHVRAPGAGLPLPTLGDRYLLEDELGDGSVLWGSGFVAAKPGDIIQWNGSNWQVDFDFESNVSVNYVIDLETNVRYEINDKGFFPLISRIYKNGFWRLQL
jgi:hypothetical protein